MTTAVTRDAPPQRLVTLFNPVVRGLLASPLHRVADGALLVLHLRGRRTGRRYDIPVGYVDLDGRLVVVTQHAWRVNLRGGADVEITHRGRRRQMHADLDEEPTAVATVLRAVIERIGWRAARRQTGLVVHVGRTPTLDELEQAVREYHLGAVTLTSSAPSR
ncbi:MAG TPA: nitroreductase/quinone reductase family protein [Kineosporiaceae bacterium]|nr:nitroreductase/quinone reductase family protein [Kineosporiaceae bacterium]